MTFTIPFPMLVGMWFSFGILCIIGATTFMCRISKVSPSFTSLGYVSVVIAGFMAYYMVSTVMNFAEALVRLGAIK